jgi:hypothetical protein
MNKTEEYTIFAIRTLQPGEEGSEYWVPRIYNELKR